MMMSQTLLKRIYPQILVCAGLLVLSGAAAHGQAASQRTDGQIEMDVVHALDAIQELKNDLITAATIESEVTLSGTVSSADSSKLAESVAEHVQGVTKVHNNLTVGNPQDANSAPAPEAGARSAQPMEEGQPDNEQEAPPQGYPQQREYAQQRPAAPKYRPATGPVTIPPGTLLQLRTSEPLNSKRARDGEPVQFTVIGDVSVGGVLAIPRGATVHGVVTEDRKSGALGGSPVLALTLTSLDLGGQSYPLETSQFKVKGPNKAGHTVGNAIGGGILGTIIGCAAGRGFGCAVGAGAGVAAGTAASAASPGPGIWIPAEARVDFHLRSPLTVTPVDEQEAARLAEGLYQGGPNLYRRGYPAYGRPYYGYPYGYPPVYYRPYYAVGGYYYWR